MASMYKIIDILRRGSGERRTSAEAKPGQYYDDWIGMTVICTIDDSVLGFPIILNYVKDNKGNPMSGWMHTSTVEDFVLMDGCVYLYTRNSAYILKELEVNNVSEKDTTPQKINGKKMFVNI